MLYVFFLAFATELPMYALYVYASCIAQYQIHKIREVQVFKDFFSDFITLSIRNV